MNPETTSLSEWYEGLFLRLFHADAAPGTIREYRCTLRVWRRPYFYADGREAFVRR